MLTQVLAVFTASFHGLVKARAAHSLRAFASILRKRPLMRSPNGDDDWWRRLSESEVDPISHASLSSLPYPPFNLVTDESHATYFDGFVLSNYLVSTGSFIHPISRRAITRDECKQLDACQREHRLGYAGVLYAFDHPEEYYLYQSENESDDVEDDPEEE